MEAFDPGAIDFDSLVDGLTEEPDSLQELLLRSIDNVGLGQVARELQQLDTDPVLFRSVLEEELPGLEIRAAEQASLVPPIRELLEDAESRADSAARWSIEVAFYNSGRTPGSIRPHGALALQRPASGNTVVPFERSTSPRNIVVPPGETVSVTFESSETETFALEAAFRQADRDFRVVFHEVNGATVVTSIARFADSVGDDVRESIEQNAEQLEF